MEYQFRQIEEKWQKHWKDTNVYKVFNDSPKPKYYVLDMFPYPSGAGLHVGHPLGYIASDIFARYKRLKGYNVLHPMGFDAFGLPAEQYAIETGQHPAVTTKNNIANFKSQLDKIGFCFDWSREVNTSDPHYYKWTQWIFLQLFKSWYNRKKNKAESIEELIKIFEAEGNINYECPGDASVSFSTGEWKNFTKKEQQEILMHYRLAYCGYGEVNWCEALGTVLANDEVVNGVSERGGYPVVKKKLRQWYLRITEYADRLLEGLQQVDFSDAMKEMQTNWIGKSSGAEIIFPLSGSPRRGEEKEKETMPGFGYAKYKVDSAMSLENAKQMRKAPTEAEEILWQHLQNKQTGYKFRRQHPVENYIADFICLDAWLIVEIDGGYHADAEQKEADEARDAFLKEIGFTTLRFTNEEVLNNTNAVIQSVIETCDQLIAASAEKKVTAGGSSLLQGEAGVRVYTTRPDTIFGVDFMVLAPEHELVEKITTAEQKQQVEEYITYVNSRSERERMAEKKITGCFTGAYALNPFNGREIPVWISEYVLAGYGTGAIMAVPCGDERDFKFAKHFKIPITNIIGDYYNGEEANPTKEAILQNSDFLNGMKMSDAIDVVIDKLEAMGIGKRKVNYKMRDAAFSRQRYWGEPFPIIWKDGIAYPLDESELPLELPHVENYKPGPEGEGPLANIPEWYLIPNPSPHVEKGTNRNVPKYEVASPHQYEMAKQMRKEHTEAENILWQFLRNNQLDTKFRRQHPIDTFIVDFVALQNSLIIEIDGSYHETEEQKQYDENRTKTLNEIGFAIIRFTNEEVLYSTDEVIDKIKKALSTRGEGWVRETNTMPGYAGSSWYFLRYMDPHDDKVFCDRKASDYWGQVDLYIGGTEHAVGHLLYSRMWTKFLHDINCISHDEPYKKLVNQGMIQGSSRFIYRVDYPLLSNKNIFISKKFYDDFNNGSLTVLDLIRKIQEITNEIYVDDEGIFMLIKLIPLHADINVVDGVELNIKDFKKWRNEEYADAEFILEDGKYICGTETEKMSKSKYNVVNPDDIVDKYGADTFRMYEMFLGPVEQSKPWDTKGIEGVHRFLKKLWRLFYDEQKGLLIKDEKPTADELKVLHKTIKKIEEDTERFSFNTAVSQFMIAVNELSDLKCHKKDILEPLLILLTPYAPHICEELWHNLGNDRTILDAAFPKYDEQFIKDNVVNYPIAVNGKTRTEMSFSADADNTSIEQEVLQNEIVQKWTEGKKPKKVIIVKGRMVNVVV